MIACFRTCRKWRGWRHGRGRCGRLLWLLYPALLWRGTFSGYFIAPKMESTRSAGPGPGIAMLRTPITCPSESSTRHNEWRHNKAVDELKLNGLIHRVAPPEAIWSKMQTHRWRYAHNLRCVITCGAEILEWSIYSRTNVGHFRPRAFRGLTLKLRFPLISLTGRSLAPATAPRMMTAHIL